MPTITLPPPLPSPSFRGPNSSLPTSQRPPLTARPRGDTRLTLPTTPLGPPKWTSRPLAERLSLIAFGTFLSLVAGYINGTTLFGAFGTTVSHTTGSSTKLGIALAEGHSSTIQLFVSLIMAFMLGGAVAGAIVGDQGFRWSRRYGWVLMLEAVFLVAAWGDMHTPWDQERHDDIARGSVWAAFACGLQNAITTTFSGAVIRTTHTTGLITDIGVVLGQAVFRWEEGRRHVWKLSVFVPLYVGFVVGGMVAVLGHGTVGEKGFLILAGFLFVGGACHAVYRAWSQWMVSRKKDREWERAYEEEFGEEGRYRDEDESD